MAKKVKTEESVIETDDLREPTVLTVPGGFSSESEAIFYFPRTLVPEAKKEILKRKILGAALTFTGIALLVVGYSQTELLQDIKGVYLLMAVLAAAAAAIFLYIPEPHLPGLIRGSMALVYLVVTIAILISIISALGEFSPDDLNGSMDELKSALPGVGEFLIIAGGILARTGGGVLKNSIRDLTDFSPAVIVLPGKFGK